MRVTALRTAPRLISARLKARHHAQRTRAAVFGERPVEQYLEEVECPVCAPGTPSEAAHRLPNRALHFLPMRHEFTYRRCSGCGLLFVSPRLGAELLRELYRHAYVPEGALTAPQVEKKARDSEAYARRMREIAPPAEHPRLLDVGCGHGFFLLAAQYAGYDVRGQEFADYSTFWQRYVPTVAARIAPAPLEDPAAFPDDSADIATMWEVAEHIQDPAATFGAVARILRPGGLLLLESPRSDTAVLGFLGAAWTQLIPEEHLYLWTETSLRRMLERCGFSIVEIRDSVSPRDAFVGRIHAVARREP